MSQNINEEIPTIDIIRQVFQWMKNKNIKEVCFKESGLKNTLSFETKEGNKENKNKPEKTFILTEEEIKEKLPKEPNSYVLENIPEQEIAAAYKMVEEQQIFTELELTRLINDIE